MAQLKNTIILGDLSVTGAAHLAKVYTNILNAPTASNDTTYGPGTAGQALVSNGTTIYWGPTIGASINDGTTSTVAYYSGPNTISSSSIVTEGTNLRNIGGYNNSDYAFSAASAIINSWIRTTGTTGWYNQTYGAGWYMPNGTWIQMYNNKQVKIQSSHATSTSNLSSQLVISSLAYNAADTTAGNAVAIELWRGANASWQIVNDGGNLIFRNNYTTSKQTTYSQQSIYLNYNTGILNAKDIIPQATNTYNLGSESLRWKALYIGTANTYGSANKPVWWNNGVPEMITYELKATVNAGTQWGVAYYSTTTDISSTAAGTAGYPLISAGSAAPVWYGGQVNTGTAAASWVTAFKGTTDSNYATKAGAVTIDGGLYVTKKTYIADTTDSNYATLAGALVVAGGANFGKKVYLKSDVDAASYATGSLVTAGGIAVTKQLRVQGVTTHGGNVVSDTNATDSIGTTGVRWKEGYFSTLLSIGAANTSYTTTDNKNTYIQPGAITLNSNSTFSSGYYLYGKGVEYAKFYVNVFGTAGTYTPADGDTPASVTAGTEGLVTLVLGNATSKTPTSETNLGLNNARGKIRIYGDGSTYTDLWSNPNGSRSCYLPYYGGTMYLTCVTGTSKVGDTNQPVYVAANNVIQACTYYLKATVNNATQWGVAYYSTTTNITSTAAGTAGYPLIGQGAAAPTWYGGQTNVGTAAGSWITTFNGTTASTSRDTGAVKVSGGVGVAGQVTALRLAANGSNTSYTLYVNGTGYINGQTTINTELNNNVGSLNIINTKTASSGYFWGVNHTNPSITAGANTCLLTGYSNSTNNQAVFGFHFAGDNNNDNYIELGLYGNNNLFRLYKDNRAYLKAHLYPDATNTYNLGSSTYRWKALYIGTADSYGSTTQPIYWNAGVPTALTYTANRLYYSASTTSFEATGHYASTAKIAINSTNAPSNTLYVNGVSEFNGNILPASAGSYSLGSKTLYWYAGFFTRTTMRHLDAGTNAVSTDHNLYIGYGAETYTSNIYFYTSTGSTDTVSERTQWFTINSNGAYALTRFGVNGQDTSYNFYVNGTSSFTNHVLMYTPTAGANAYGDGSALEVREVNMVTTGQSAWSYAPKIGFHWGGRYQGTFGLHSNGAYYLSIGAGQGNATLYAGSVYGAVWNDYAEYRIANTKEPGRVIKETPTGEMTLTTQRLEKGCEIISDTFGFAIGEDDKAKTPTAATGRVLAYTDKPRETFELGMPVCSGPNGTVSQMTEEEARMYPWCIIGTVSEIPTYEEWGTGKVKVNGRIWIRIR